MSARLRRQDVVLARVGCAICVLVLIPESVIGLWASPDRVGLAVFSWTLAALSCWNYRRAMRRWQKGDDDD